MWRMRREWVARWIGFISQQSVVAGAASMQSVALRSSVSNSVAFALVVFLALAPYPPRGIGAERPGCVLLGAGAKSFDGAARYEAPQARMDEGAAH